MTRSFHVPAAGVVGDWTLEPIQTLVLLVLAGLYARGSRRARRGGSAIGWLRPATFAMGWLLLVVALVSPMHHAAEQLLSAHMAQHTILLIAPLLILAGRAGTRVLQALPTGLRGDLAGWAHRLQGLTGRAIALFIMVAVVVAWHIPAIFEPAARVPVLHALEHTTILIAATLYWASILGVGAHRSDGYGASLASILALMLIGGAIGGLMTFSTVPWYPGYAAWAGSMGVDWLTDQQLAGVWMWVPMGLVLMGVGAWLAYRWAMAMTDRDDPVGSEPVQEMA